MAHRSKLILAAAFGAALIAFHGAQNSRPTDQAATPIAAKPPDTGKPSPVHAVRFERNDGQTADAVRFVHRASGGTLFLTDEGATAVLDRRHAIRMRFDGATGTAVVGGERRLASYSNYFLGNDPAAWRPRVPHFAVVRYEDVYAGIDVRFHGENGGLEYDFEVAPGADPGAIALAFDGADTVDLAPHGDLIVTGSDRDWRHRRPVVYQDGPDGRTPVDGRFVLDGDRARFEVAAYDRALALVIDPQIEFSTYMGSSGSERAFALTLAADGLPVVAGDTHSLLMPTTPGVIDTVGETASDGFVTKFDATGSNLVFSTYFGGTGRDAAAAIVTVSGGNLVLTGETQSSDFPTVSPVQANFAGGIRDAIVMALAPDGTSLSYATYLGGSGSDVADSIHVDDTGAVYVAGYTDSTDYPIVTGAYQETHGGANDLFVTKIDRAGLSLAFSTYIGGSTDEGGSDVGLAVDSSGRATVASATDSSDYPTTPGSLQPLKQTGLDGCVAQLSPDGTSLEFSTILGGNALELLTGVALDASGNFWVTGQMVGTDVPTANPFQAQPVAMADSYVGRLSADGTTLLFGSFMGGGAFDGGTEIAIDSRGDAWVLGRTASTDFPVVDPTQPTLEGSTALTISKISAAGGLVFSTYAGGNGSEIANRGLAIGADDSVFVAGYSSSSNFPLVGTPFQQRQGSNDVVLMKFADGGGSTPAGAGTLYLTRGTFKINFAQHAKTNVKDALVLKGCMNPASANTDLTGATFSVTVGGEQLVAPQALDAKGRVKSAKGAAPGFRFLFKPKNGLFNAVFNKIDLRTAIPAANQTGNSEITLPIEITIAGAGLTTDTVSGDLVFSVKGREDKSARGAYSFSKGTSETAVYKATRTQVSQGRDGGHRLSLRAALAPDGGGPLAIAGDVTITVGDASPIVIPAASIRSSGSAGAETYSYSRSLGEVAGLRKFSLANRRKTLTLSTDELAGTGVSPSGDGEPTSHALPVTIEIDTGSETLVFGSTVEIQRPRATTGRWKR